VVISLLALAAGVSAFNIYDKYQESEGRMDHIAVVRISGEMGTGSEAGDGSVIAAALAKAYNNPHAKAVIIEAEPGGGGPSDAIIIYRQINALRSHQQKIERISHAESASKTRNTGDTSASRSQDDINAEQSKRGYWRSSPPGVAVSLPIWKPAISLLSLASKAFVLQRATTPCPLLTPFMQIAAL
jgi:protease-4